MHPPPGHGWVAGLSGNGHRKGLRIRLRGRGDNCTWARVHEPRGWSNGIWRRVRDLSRKTAEWGGRVLDRPLEASGDVVLPPLAIGKARYALTIGVGDNG